VDSHLVWCVSALASLAEGGRTRSFGEQGCGTLALSVGGLGQEAGRDGHRRRTVVEFTSHPIPTG
jgi:hypothetical protein